jgi:ABC-type nitrate/sulfonate/bicarbonate transport system substrate-binding protein
LQKNPDTAKKLVAGIFATGKWANTHPRESADILVKVTKADPAVVGAVQRRLFATSSDRKYVEGTLTLAARYGMLQRPVTFEEFSAFPS